MIDDIKAYILRSSHGTCTISGSKYAPLCNRTAEVEGIDEEDSMAEGNAAAAKEETIRYSEAH